ncbi:hypothetical protein SynMVIR181_00998 [Synechococcus sp. MVIR-18-1]|nr:hypothetical protein SynMVIR181_00998 [Synechococcus sp. MVIR-18-1]
MQSIASDCLQLKNNFEGNFLTIAPPHTYRRTLRHLFGGETLLPSISITLPLVSSLAPQPLE